MRNWLIKLLGGYTEPPAPIVSPEIKISVSLTDTEDIRELRNAVSDLARAMNRLAKTKEPKPMFTTCHVENFFTDTYPKL